MLPKVPLLARVVAVVVALAFAFPFFGLIDLLTAVIPDQRFDRFYLVETGWGLLCTVLVAAPLALFAINPGWTGLLQQVLVAGVAVVACALVTPAPYQVAPGAVLVLVPLLLLRWSRLPVWPFRDLRVRELLEPAGILVVTAAAAALWYAVDLVRLARAGAADDDTWGLMHLPMQAAFGLALAGSAAVAWLTRVSGASDRRAPWLPPAVAAIWVGVVSVAYPAHLAGLGRAGGVAAVAWGVMFGIAAWAVSPRSSGRRPPHPRTRPT